MPLFLKDIWGNDVQLTSERLAHLLEHPELRKQENKIADTLLQPDTVVQSQSDDTVKLFFRLYRGLTIGDKYLCVVVKYLEASIFVITAYFTDRIKRGEVIWRR
jgi:hypothetical protein